MKEKNRRIARWFVAILLIIFSLSLYASTKESYEPILLLPYNSSIIEGELQSDNVTFLRNKGGKIEAIEATGRVEWRWDSKILFGDNLVYHLDTNYIIVKGNPARLIDLGGPCFNITAEEILIDAEQGFSMKSKHIRSVTKVIDCPANEN
jgi:hypothetical protein